jgi:hypothetical protein
MIIIHLEQVNMNTIEKQRCCCAVVALLLCLSDIHLHSVMNAVKGQTSFGVEYVYRLGNCQGAVILY